MAWEEEEQVTGEVAMPLQGQLWMVLAGCVPPHRVI